MGSDDCLNRYDGNVLFASIVLGGLSWLQTWSTSDDCESTLHLKWFLLLYILHWQAYLYFWRQHEFALSRNLHKDPLLHPDTGYIVRSCLNTWILLFAILSSFIYIYLFLQSAVYCSMCEFKMTAIYQWILVFLLLIFVFGMKKIVRRIKRSWRILSKILYSPAKIARLQTKLASAKRNVNSESGLKNYFVLSKSVDDFKSKSDWRSDFLLLYVPLLDVHEVEGQPANSLDLHFIRHRLTRLITSCDPKGSRSSCPICSEAIVVMDRVISLSCCLTQNQSHWSCIRQRLISNSGCVDCGSNSLTTLKNTLFNLALVSAELARQAVPGLDHEELQVPLLG